MRAIEKYEKRDRRHKRVRRRVVGTPDRPRLCVFRSAKHIYAQVVDDTSVHLRVFERGVGETLACGSGACAAVVVGRIRDWLEPRVTVALPGGELVVEWDGEGTSMWLTGPTQRAFEGEFEL